MIDFNKEGFFARLKKVKDDEFEKVLKNILIDDEIIVSTYQSVRDGVVFTNKRIIAINVEGVTGKKKDYTSIPYNKITTYSIESSGVFDIDCELDIFISGLGKVQFEFVGRTDVANICKNMSEYILR